MQKIKYIIGFFKTILLEEGILKYYINFKLIKILVFYARTAVRNFQKLNID